MFQHRPIQLFYWAYGVLFLGSGTPHNVTSYHSQHSQVYVIKLAVAKVFRPKCYLNMLGITVHQISLKDFH